MKKTGKRLLAAMLLFCTILIGAAGYEVMAADEAQSTESTSETVNSADDLPGKRIGVQLGTTGDIYVSDYESDGSGTVVERYNKGADAIQALKQGKIDCVVIDEQPAIKFVEQNTGIRILDEEFTLEEYAFVIAKDNTELLDKVNSVLEKLEADGTIANIQKNYIGTEDEIGKFPYESKDVSHENGTLTVGTNAEFPPYESYEDGQIVGIDMDIMRAVSDELGMELKIEDMAFDSITLLITVLALLVGVVFGFLIAIVRTNHDRNGGLTILKALCKLYLTIVRGTPVMIQLLIIYYVIFQSIDTGKIVVAVIAFGLNSAAYVAEIVRSGIMAVDIGQFEAGRSLGLNYKQTMMSIILPQAVKNILPALCNEFISLLKETSISGYIGLMDLTKGGDIIRSVTYEAFMPLIAVALIYLIMVMGLSKVVNLLERKLRSNER